MEIMIAGAGTVGYSLAQTLSYKHNVIVVDKDPQTLQKLDEDIDILTLQGDVENIKTFQTLEGREMDLFIAVTDSDEANLLSTLIVDEYIKVKKKIIRLKNDGFLHSHILEKLAIDTAIFPDITVANKVKALFTFPKANNVKAFHQTKNKLISIKVQGSDEKQYCVGDFYHTDIRVVGIDRNKIFFIPGNEEFIKENDLVYFFGRSESIQNASNLLDKKMPEKIQKVVIFGANAMAQKIAKALLDRQLNIKIIEKNRDLCKAASELLQDKVTVINSAYEDHRLFEEEGLKNADIIIAAGDNDEKNIVKCMEAREYGIEKVVAINNDKAYYDLMHKLGIVVVRGSKMGAHYAILEKIVSSTIVTERQYCGGQALLFMRKIYFNSELIDHTVHAPKIKDVLVLVVRDESMHMTDEINRFKEGDIIVVFGDTEKEEKIQKWIYTL